MILAVKLFVLLLCAPLPASYTCSVEALAYEDEDVKSLADVLILAADGRVNLVIERAGRR